MTGHTWRVLAVASVLLAANACGSDPGSADQARATTTASTPAARPTGDVDTTVQIAAGGLHLHCAGSGDTTVLLLAGWGDGGENWGDIEPALNDDNRVCSYARFGTGTSDAPRGTQSFMSQATD